MRPWLIVLIIIIVVTVVIASVIGALILTRPPPPPPPEFTGSLPTFPTRPPPNSTIIFGSPCQPFAGTACRVERVNDINFLTYTFNQATIRSNDGFYVYYDATTKSLAYSLSPTGNWSYDGVNIKDVSSGQYLSYNGAGNMLSVSTDAQVVNTQWLFDGYNLFPALTVNFITVSYINYSNTGQVTVVPVLFSKYGNPIITNGVTVTVTN